MHCLSRERLERLIPLACTTAWIIQLAALLYAGFVVGCSSKATVLQLYPVTGRVMLSGGVPIGNGTVIFEPIAAPGLLAVGRIQPDGTFTLETPKLRSAGAIEGEHRVAIVPDGNVPRGRSPIPVPYRDHESSDLIVVVRRGANQLPPFTFVARSKLVRRR